MGSASPVKRSAAACALRCRSIALPLAETESPEIAQAWFQGLNPQLNDRSPARMLREGELDEVGPGVIAAARAFLIGG